MNRGSRGRVIVWCAYCDRWWRLPAGQGWTGRCPRCSAWLKERRCSRCGHRWTARGDPSHPSQVCPLCASPYWNRERIGPKVKNKEGDEGI